MPKITREEALAEIERRKQIREQQEAFGKNESEGLSGVGNDVMSSLASAPDAFKNMITSIPGGARNVAKYATNNNPVETLGNLGAGGVESGAGLLSSPKVFARYIAEKFPRYGEFLNKGRALRGEKSLKDDPTLYESLMNFEKNHGMGAQSEEEQSVRNLGGLLFGGKALSRLPNMGTRVATLAAQQGGEGGDPLHAAILGMIGEMSARGAKKAPQTIKAIPDAVSSLPEHAGTALASGLESLADYSAKIPGAGPLLHPALGTVGSYLKHISVAPEELAKRNLMGDITHEDIPAMVERDAAGKRLGLSYLTPSELLDSPFESVKQGDIGRTTQGSKLLFKQGALREASEEAAINRLLDSIHESKLDPIKNAAYEKTMNAEVPDDFIARQTQRPVIQKAIKKLESNAAYRQMLEEELGVKLSDIKPNSFRYWDMIKRVLGDFEENTKKDGKPTTESAVHGDTRRSMVKEMDLIEPEYRTARNISERKFTRQKLEKVFDKKDKTFNNFDSFLKSKKNYSDILHKLESFPEATQILKDIKLFSGKMVPNNPTTRAAAALKRTGMSDARNPIEAKKRQLDERYGMEHDVAGVNLMTDPMFMQKLIERLKERGN